MTLNVNELDYEVHFSAEPLPPPNSGPLRQADKNMVIKRETVQ